MEVYTPEEVAQILKLEERTIRGWLRDGKLRGAKLGNVWRIKKEDLEIFLEENMNQKKNDDTMDKHP